MKEKLKNKKVVYTIIGIVSILLIMIVITYAYWLVTKTQTNENAISSACLDITLTNEKNDIELTNQYPMSDEEGMKLVPYEFTVTNNCNTSIDYQVSLEALGNDSNAIKTSAIKVALNDNTMLLSKRNKLNPTISNAYEARTIGYGKLKPSGTKGSNASYQFRIWIDKDAPLSETNKTFRSKISVTVGQGIEILYEEDTLAYHILASAGGNMAASNFASTFRHEILKTSSFNMYLSCYFGTKYTYNENTQTYKLSGDLVKATVNECKTGVKECGNFTLNSPFDSYENSMLYEIVDWNYDNGSSIVTANTIQYVNDFYLGSESHEAGLYKTQDDFGDSYYFRGNVTNNYVEFGTYAKDTTFIAYDSQTWEEKIVEIKAGEPMYWRIVRINGDKTIRLVYAGTKSLENGIIDNPVIGFYLYNPGYSHEKYSGYTYNQSETDITQVDSTVKTIVDEWYDKHLEDTYGIYIADTIFCNDKSIIAYEYYDEELDDYITTTTRPSLNYYIVNYSSPKRLNADKAPSLKCVNKNDRYTVNDTTNGNGLLTKPIALLTADEIAFAGASVYQQNPENYLASNFSYWTLTPIYWDNDFGDLAIWTMFNGQLSYESILFESNIRPVINLKANVEFTGDGTMVNPYKIVIE